MTATIYPHETFTEYCAADGYNFSRLKLFATSPKHFIDTVPRKDTVALSLGRLIHMRVLEPELYAATVRDADDWPGGMTADGKRKTMNKRSDAYKEWLAVQDTEGKLFASAADMNTCENINDALLEHGPALELLSGDGHNEQSMRWECLGIECKSRIDRIQTGKAIIDLKSTQSISPRRFGSQAYAYKYHVQAAFYRAAEEASTGMLLPYYIVAVEKTPPYDVGVYEIPEAAIELGRIAYTEWILTMNACNERNEWPGQVPGVTELQLPEYAFTDQPLALTIGGEEVRF